MSKLNYSPIHLQLLLEEQAELEFRKKHPKIVAYFDQLILEARKKRDKGSKPQLKD